jgi:hypothetical protein
MPNCEQQEVSIGYCHPQLVREGGRERVERTRPIRM